MISVHEGLINVFDALVNVYEVLENVYEDVKNSLYTYSLTEDTLSVFHKQAHLLLALTQFFLFLLFSPLLSYFDQAFIPFLAELADKRFFQELI